MENKSVTLAAQVLAPAVSEIRSLLEVSRKNVAQQVNQELLSTYWKIGEIVVRCEQNDSIRAAYGEKTLSQLSRALTKELGKGFSRSNVYNMRQFYLSYPIFQTVSGKLSWSHYCELLSISDKEKRSFYEKEAVNSGWSVREMKRQVESSLFERLLLSRGDANKEQVLALAEKGVDYTKPEDIIKDPYVLDFLGLPSGVNFYEKDLEKALIDNLQQFLLELGRGFSFVSRQYRFKTDNENYYVDLVFYNFILKCFVLIDLKVGKLTYQDIGQMDFYTRYFEENIRTETDNPTIGIVLCTERDNTIVKYSVMNDSNQLFASKYKLYLPTEEELINELETSRKQIENNVK